MHLIRPLSDSDDYNGRQLRSKETQQDKSCHFSWLMVLATPRSFMTTKRIINHKLDHLDVFFMRFLLAHEIDPAVKISRP